MGDKLRFAIVGTGIVSRYFVTAIEANDAELVAVAHYDPARFDEISTRFGVPCASLDDLLAREDIDVVCICTPSGHHAEQTIAAARAGKHLIVEKPMALSLEDADAMISACAEAGVKLGVALQRRALPLYLSVRQAIEAGDLGALVLGTVVIPYERTQAYYDQAAWRGTWALDGGGVLMNQGVHLIDLLVWYMGDPVQIKANAATLRHNIDVEDTLAATLRFANGAMATVTATTATSPGLPHRVEVYGTRGSIQIEGESVLRWNTPADAKIEPTLTNHSPSEGAWSGVGGLNFSGHIAIVADFIDAVRNDREPLIGGGEGRRNLAAVLGIYDAANIAKD